MKKEQIDYAQFEKDRIIKISDLIEEIFRKIWLIVVFAVAFTVIFAGYKYSRDKSDARAANALENESGETTLTDEELEQVNNVLLLQNRLENQQEYLSNSILMKINAYKENRVNLQYFVNANENVFENAINSLKYYVSSGALANDIQSKYPDIESNYLAELISFENDADEMQIGDTEYLDMQSSGSVFGVSIIEQDEASCQLLADNISEAMNKYQEQSQGTIGQYALVLVDKSVTKVVDTELQSIQNSKINDMNNLKNSIKDAKGNLSDVQLSVLEKTIQDASSEGISEKVSNNAMISVKLNKKYMGIGALAGIVLAVILIIVRYVLRGTLNVEDEMQHMFNLSVFGQVEINEKKNILVKAWRKIRNRKQLSPDEQKYVILANIKTFCKQHNIEKLLFVSSRDEVSTTKCMMEIMEDLKEEGITTELAEKYPYSEDAIYKTTNYNYIILVEVLRKSKYDEVLKEVLKCMEQGHEIKGTVLLEL